MLYFAKTKSFRDKDHFYNVYLTCCSHIYCTHFKYIISFVRGHIVSPATDLRHYDKTSTGTSTGTSHILRYIIRYPPTHLPTHPPTQPPHILRHMMCIHSVSPTSQTYDVMTRHPPVHPPVQSTTSETPSETSSDASSDTATAHPLTYDVHSFPHPPAHLLAC